MLYLASRQHSRSSQILQIVVFYPRGSQERERVWSPSEIWIFSSSLGLKPKASEIKWDYQDKRHWPWLMFHITWGSKCLPLLLWRSHLKVASDVRHINGSWQAPFLGYRMLCMPPPKEPGCKFSCDVLLFWFRILVSHYLCVIVSSFVVISCFHFKHACTLVYCFHVTGLLD